MSILDSSCSSSLSKTLSLLSPIPRPPPPRFSLHNTSSHSHYLSLSAARRPRSLLRSLSRLRTGAVEDSEEEEFEDSDGDEEEEEIDDDAFAIDVEKLEEEAKLVVREYSDSLSRELRIEDETTDRKQTRGRQRRQKTATRNVVTSLALQVDDPCIVLLWGLPLFVVLYVKMIESLPQGGAWYSIPDNLLQKVTIIGRPNVGKSALFNRLVGGNKAIVVDEPGVTRDRLYGRSVWGVYEFMVVDTGGVLSIAKSQTDVMEELAITTTIGMEGIPLMTREAAVARMPSMIEKQAIVAVEEASVILFLVDGQAGLTAADVEIADWLRKHYSHKCVILAVNKCESPQWFFSETLRIPCPPLSSLDQCLQKPLPVYAGSFTTAPAAFRNLPIAAADHQTLLEPAHSTTIVSPVSGTTRDAIDTEFTGPDGQKFRLIDTAGIRKRASVASSGSTTEALSVNRAFRAVRRSDVVALVIEAMACITEQDWRIAERIEREGKGCLIVVNKWDTIPNKNQETATHYEQDVREKLRNLVWAPIVYATAIAGHSVEKCNLRTSWLGCRNGWGFLNVWTLIKEVLELEKMSFAVIKASWRSKMRMAVLKKAGHWSRGKGEREAAIRPPTFVFFVNDAKLFSETYRRYMEKQLRSDAGFAGTPIRLLWRSRKKMTKDDRMLQMICIGRGFNVLGHSHWRDLDVWKINEMVELVEMHYGSLSLGTGEDVLKWNLAT
ncbi:hypothetical protein RHMOL_Rhmol13G0291000 [Rhododendron molle]|uniref:Uncharacterized protein n=1 Tax=Rhododendron molle TaxID=49168 RepID=A0ACC0LCB6_RHOML|nr:hypothetical protein RHMOL_Rhmol13G0291000 [Rhododendron molle]